jgi:kojibiose phosphorylase
MEAINETTDGAHELALEDDTDWTITWNGFAPLRERDLESLMTIGNGYLGARGSLEEVGPSSRPATLIAGVFSATAETGNMPELAAAPDWLIVRVWVEGESLSLGAGEILSHQRTLDMRRGALTREWVHRTPNGRVTRVAFLRFASLADRHTLGLRALVTPENYGGRIRVESMIASGIASDLMNPKGDPRAFEHRQLEPLASKAIAGGGAALAMRAKGRGVQIVMGARASFNCDTRGGDGSNSQVDGFSREVETEATRVAEIFEWDAQPGRRYRIDKIVSVWTSRDLGTQTPGRQAREAEGGGANAPASAVVNDELLSRAVRRLNDAAAKGFDSLLASSAALWEERWRAAELMVEGDKEAQREARFAIYHLMIAGNPEDERASVSARTLSGEAYHGHVFWDTEIFMLPFYAFTHPPTARALLMYRYWTLPAARAKARAFGYRGAMYPWESADTGEEVTPTEVALPTGQVIKILTGLEEQHISADVPYAVWQYWRVTGDDEFMRAAGAEVLLECARFWASRVEEGSDGRFHIRRVIGPDEYHETVDDNAFTNVMAQWTLERADDVADWMTGAYPDAWRTLCLRLSFDDAERAAWRQIAERMYTGFDEETGLIEQFAGFFKLAEVDLKAFEPRTAPMDILLGRERAQASQVVKQADVLMLFQLLPDRYPREVIERNFRYYEPRTGHGSSLSPATHALIAARLGDLDTAHRYFHKAAEIDLGLSVGAAAGGVHAAAFGGMWQAAVLGFAGMRLRDEQLAFDPHMPEERKRLQISLVYRGRRLRVVITARPLSARIELREGDQPLVICLGSLQAKLAPESPVEAIYVNGAWRKEGGE